MPISKEAFWELAARRELPRFRFFRRSITVEQMDRVFAGDGLEGEWLALKEKMQPCERKWPFEFNVRSYLGFPKGFLVLRNGRPIGGILVMAS